MLPATDDAGPLRLDPPKGMAVRALDSNRGFVLEQRAHLATVLLEWVVLGGVLAYAS